MLTKASLLAAATFGVAKAQSDYWYIPSDLTGQFCDGITRPDWDACEAAYVDWFINTDMHIGPGFLEGQTLTVEGCQLRYVKCKESDYEWTQEDEGGLFAILRRTCDPLGAGGVRRQGDLCVIVEDPSNPFGPKKRSRDAAEIEDREAEHGVENKAVAAPVRRTHAKDLPVSRSLGSEVIKKLERRQGCESGTTCYGYTEQTFAGNIRGIKQNVCDNILPDGASCAESRSVTITDSYTAGFDVSAGLKDIIDVTASFSTTHSEAVTTTLTTTITVDCPGRSGRIVWYPLMEVSSGECTQGDCRDGLCWDLERTQCTTRKPVVPEEGRISGEFAVECI